MNEFVDEITDGVIEELLPQGSVTTETNLFLANAAFLKGKWLVNFPNTTYTKQFNGIVPADIEMMHREGNFKYGKLLSGRLI